MEKRVVLLVGAKAALGSEDRRPVLCRARRNLPSREQCLVNW